MALVLKLPQSETALVAMPHRLAILACCVSILVIGLTSTLFNVHSVRGRDTESLRGWRPRSSARDEFPSHRHLTEASPWQPRSRSYHSSSCVEDATSTAAGNLYRQLISRTRPCARAHSIVRIALVEASGSVVRHRAVGAVASQATSIGLGSKAPDPASVVDAPQAVKSATSSNIISGASTTLPQCPMASIPLHPGYTCETPYSRDVRVHVLVTLLSRDGYRDLRHLGMIGLSNADVFIYLRCLTLLNHVFASLKYLRVLKATTVMLLENSFCAGKGPRNDPRPPLLPRQSFADDTSAWFTLARRTLNERGLPIWQLSKLSCPPICRTAPEDTRPAKVELPCGMKLHERLLLPNLGEEGAVFATHVAAVYDDMPDAIIALHGGKLTAWHARCRRASEHASNLLDTRCDLRLAHMVLLTPR